MMEKLDQEIQETKQQMENVFEASSIFTKARMSKSRRKSCTKPMVLEELGVAISSPQP